MFHVGMIFEDELLPLIHCGDSKVRRWMEDRFPECFTYSIEADLSQPIEMIDSGRVHYPSLIAEDLGMDNLAYYLKRNGERQQDLILCLKNKGFTCIHYFNKNEGPGDSWIVWDFKFKQLKVN